MELTKEQTELSFNNSYNDEKHLIELCSETNTIKFTYIGKNYLYGYVTGEFNHWQKEDKFKLDWQIDNNDKRFKLSKEVNLSNRLEDGTYKYRYHFIDHDGSEIIVNNINNQDLTFSWANPIDKVELITSNDYFSDVAPLEVVCVKKSSTGELSILEAEFEIISEVENVKLQDGLLLINESVTKDYDITILAKVNDVVISKKTVKLLSKIPEGNEIHYIRLDNDYAGINHEWSCWNFGKGHMGVDVSFGYTSDLGKIAYVTGENVIIRKKMWGKGWFNDWAEQTRSYYLNNIRTLYIVDNSNDCYIRLRDAISATKPKIKEAILDDNNMINIYLTHKPLLGTTFNLYINGELIKNTISLVDKDNKKVILTHIPTNFNSNDLIEVRASNMFSNKKVLLRGYLNKFYYEGSDLGATFNKNAISLKLWAPTASKVEVVLYNHWNMKNDDYIEAFNMNFNKTSGIFYTSIPSKRNEGKYYLYKLYFRELDSLGNYYERVTYAVDPYAVGVSVNGDKGSLISLNSNKCRPLFWNNDKRPYITQKEDSIIYEVHLRDFTGSKKSSVKEKYRGTYLGAVENGTFYQSASTKRTVSTGLSHLKELGITHVHLLPTFDFSSVDESKKSNSKNRNWGYDPKNFNVPEGSYSTNPYNSENRIKEFREMVMKFHKNGIRVVADMVYNHMAETRNMDNIVPRYYFRTNLYGQFTNGSGCGNELATERPMVRKFVVDSCLHWVNNYKIDGLRFDLMELIDIDTIREITDRVTEIDPCILVYGEPWKGGDSPVINGTYKGSQKGEEFSVFNDTFRNAIRGNNNPSQGFINGDQHNAARAWSIIEGLKGSIYTLTSNPRETINYVDAHDNYTLWDHIVKSQNPFIKEKDFKALLKINMDDNKYIKQSILGMSIVLLSQGIPFIQGGSEFLRTKYGDHNSYRSSDDVNCFDWSQKAKLYDVYEYIRGIIRIRKTFSVLRNTDPNSIRKNINITFANNDDKSGVILYHLKNFDNTYSFKNLVVIFNPTSVGYYDINNYLPQSQNGIWTVIANDKTAGTVPIDSYLDGSLPKMNEYSLMIIHD